MTSQEMMRATATPGYWFANMAPLGSTPNWVEQVAPMADSGLLFGYEQKEFLQKQYKREGR